MDVRRGSEAPCLGLFAEKYRYDGFSQGFDGPVVGRYFPVHFGRGGLHVTQRAAGGVCRGKRSRHIGNLFHKVFTGRDEGELFYPTDFSTMLPL